MDAQIDHGMTPRKEPMLTTSNRVRQALEQGRTLAGMILFTGSPMMIEMMAAAGVDFVIIDMEHSALDLDRAGHLIRAADAAAITPRPRHVA